MITTSRGLADARGSATVEFALIVPVLLVILLAGIDFSRALVAYTTIGNAAREGVRYATLHPGATAPEIKGAIQRYAGSLDPDQITLLISETQRSAAAPGIPSRIARSVTVRVTLQYPWESTSALAATFFSASGSRMLTSSASMEAQR